MQISSMGMFLLGPFASFIFIAYFVYSLFGHSYIRRNGQKLRRPPNTLPLAGNGLLFLQARQKLFSWFVECERRFGFETFEISVPSLPSGVVINDPRNLEFVLKNESVFRKGTFFKHRSWDLFGNGIINADGELWKAQRKAGLDFLSSSKIKILTNVALPEYLDSTIEFLSSRKSEEVVDLESVFHELTTQLMGRMAYDMEMHAKDPFTEAFEFASGATGERFQNPLWKITEMIFGKRLRQSLTEIKRFGRSIVANAVQARESIEADEGKRKKHHSSTTAGSLIYSLLDSISDPQLVADAALNYLSAGRDTTAQALTWTFYLLMHQPHVVSKLREEISGLSVKTNKEGSCLESSSFQPNALPYTLAIFYEALRLYPPVPFELKQCQQAATLPDGTFLPMDAIVVWCTWAMNRSRLIWGEDAAEFRPERWLEGSKIVTKSAYEFPVFNGGPRSCLGKKMAECITVMVIAKLISEFDFAAVDSKERISRNSLTLPMKGGMPCYVRRRSRKQKAIS